MPLARNDLSLEDALAAVYYDPSTGRFYRVTSGGSVRAGELAGTEHWTGYRRIVIGGRSYAAARLAVLFLTGRWPTGLVDHRDLDSMNDRATNLRPCTFSQNGANRGVPRNSTSGFKGVTFHRRARKWQATIKHHGVKRFLGYHATPEQAAAAYATAAREAFGEFARAA